MASFDPMFQEYNLKMTKNGKCPFDIQKNLQGIFNDKSLKKRGLQRFIAK